LVWMPRSWHCLRRAPSASSSFDLVAFAATQPRTPEMLVEYEEAGATWWVEAVDPLADPLPDFRARIGRGPIG
jgi:hypothetical protein